MRPRYCSRTILLTLAAGLVVSCAASPPRRAETPSILEIRGEYLRANPSGRFNDAIARGEVTVGMGYYDVLASWGFPDGVENSKKGQERWSYLLREDNGVDWIRYDFVFAERAVVEWESTRNVASGHAPAPDDPRGVTRRMPPTPAATLGDATHKGGSGTSLR